MWMMAERRSQMVRLWHNMVCPATLTMLRMSLSNDGLQARTVEIMMH